MTSSPPSRRLGDLLPLAGALGLACVGSEVIARLREADLTGQVALITGGSRGLGLALARELASEGCRLAICARDADELQRAADDLRSRGAEVLTVNCDVAIRAHVDEMVDEVIAHYGQIDLLFTVAGIIEVGRLDLLDVQDFRRTMDIMFWGTLYPILAVLPGMRDRHYGRIATITSIGGKISVPHLLPYSAAKFAAAGLSEGLSAELMDEGIHVTTIVPGLMRTGSHLAAEFRGDADRQRREYQWFALGATSPLATRADRAARIIIRAVKRGETERTFPLIFDLASRVHCVAPATTIRLLRVIDRLLPSGNVSAGDVATARGMAVEERIDLPAWKAVTALGRDAADAFNEKIGREPESPASGA